jgi:hypothetical protein
MPKLRLNVEDLVIDSFETPLAQDTASMMITPRTNAPGCVPGSAATVCYC